MSYRTNNIILIISILIGFVLVNFFKSYIGIVTLYITIILLPNKYSIYNLFFILPFMSMYDIIGFEHTFNYGLGISFIKMLFYYRKIDKTPLISLFLITIIELSNILIYGYVDNNMIPFLSLIISFVLLILCCSNSKKMSFDTAYNSLFWGIILSSLLAIANQIYNSSQFNIINNRFHGLFRDPNYFSFFILVLLFSSFKLCKIHEGKFNYYAIVLVILGFLSTSKMFLIGCLGGFVVKLFYKIRLRKVNMKITKKQFKIAMISVVLSVIVITVLAQTNYLNIISTNYIKRFDSQDLTTGRSEIVFMYFKALINFPNFLLFGASNTYYNFIISDSLKCIGYNIPYSLTAHNTYLDIVLSWGIIGTILFTIFIKNNFKIYMHNCKKNQKKLISDNIVYLLVIGFSFLSLSFLSGDCFSLVLLFTIMFLCDGKENEKC